MVVHKCAGVEKKRLLMTLEAQRLTILELENIAEYGDFGERGHLSRVQSICWILAYRARTTSYKKQISCDDAIDISLASALHDIGKVGIPSNILNKPGKLTKDEFEIMKTHVNIGVDIIDKIRGKHTDSRYINTARELTAYHHEKWDGGGYPNGMRGLEIPISARICAIADVYDALREKRPYKEPFTHIEALDIIEQGRGINFDPILTDIFIKYNKDMQIAFNTNKGISLMEVLVTG